MNRISDSEQRKTENSYPVLFENEENCCGCSACFSVCPAGAIAMKPNKEGFLYPEVDTSKCICCYRCLSVCAFKTDQKLYYQK